MNDNATRPSMVIMYFAAFVLMGEVARSGAVAPGSAAGAATTAVASVAEGDTCVRERWAQEFDALTAALTAAGGQVPSGVPVPFPETLAPSPALHELLAATATAAGSLKSVLEQINSWESSRSDNGTPGTISDLLSTAQMHAVERQHRRRLQSEVAVLLELLVRWQAELARRAPARPGASVPVEAEEPDQEAGASAQAPGGRSETLKLSDFRFHEVQVDATLSQISSLPEVYGDPGLWRVLHSANRDKCPDPAQAVAEGTVLVVPDLDRLAVRSPETIATKGEAQP